MDIIQTFCLIMLIIVGVIGIAVVGTIFLIFDLIRKAVKSIDE